ncbi:hypothetical protein [Mycolicibacterium llatzerense]|uniref:hypothetical protein n=1 Tax=Mycolicibacterium llatzerense TaxID=280871 RepID=UPI0031D7B107
MLDPDHLQPGPEQCAAELDAVAAELAHQIRTADTAAEHASAAGDHHGISARYESGATLTALRMPTSAPLTFTPRELATILTGVLQNAFDASRAAAAAAFGGPEEDSELPQQGTYAEASRYGDITIALDATGRVLWCTLTDTAGRWDAGRLTERILLLHNAAAMRANSITPKFGTNVTAGIKEFFYTEEQIAQYRLDNLTF